MNRKSEIIFLTIVWVACIIVCYPSIRDIFKAIAKSVKNRIARRDARKDAALPLINVPRASIHLPNAAKNQNQNDPWLTPAPPAYTARATIRRQENLSDLEKCCTDVVPPYSESWRFQNKDGQWCSNGGTANGGADIIHPPPAVIHGGNSSHAPMQNPQAEESVDSFRTARSRPFSSEGNTAGLAPSSSRAISHV